MKSARIRPIKRLTGEIEMPGDKSISHRAVMAGALAKGITRIKGLLDCDDCNYTIKAFRDMGIAVKKSGGVVLVDGNGLRGLKKPAGALDVGNSGTTMRIMAGIVAGQNFETVLTGDKSLLRRPMNRIVEPLASMGVDIKAAGGGTPPVTVKGGPVRALKYVLPVPSAQVKSAVLFAALYADGTTVVEEAFKSRDHTERMLKYFGAGLEADNLKISLTGGKELSPKDLDIPGDISSASFFIVAATLLEGSRIKIRGVNINPTRAGIVDVLSRMGADIKITGRRGQFEPVGDIEVKSSSTSGTVIEEGEIPGIIDELPIIFVLAALSKGRTVIRGASELRVKETDRINSMKDNLDRMGGVIRLSENEITIEGVGRLRGSSLRSYGDHRTCMAMTIASLAATGESSMDDVSCVSKSFPGFFDVLKGLS